METSTSAMILIKKQRGMTQSVLAKCADGGYYVLKFKNNPQGLNALVSEVVTARLGHFLLLPVPAYAFVDVADRLTHDPNFVIERGNLRLSYQSGVQFGSRTPLDDFGTTEVIDYIPGVMSRWVDDLPAFAGTLVLDAWTGNADFRRVVYVKSPKLVAYKPVFIDHDRSLEPFFDPASEKHYPAVHFPEFYDFVRGWGSFEPWLTLAETAGRVQLEALVTGFPREWGVSDAFSALLLEYLVNRTGQIRAHIDCLRDGRLVQFKNWGKPWPALWSWAVKMDDKLGAP